MSQVKILQELAEKKKAFDISKLKDKRFTPIKNPKEVIKKTLASPSTPKSSKGVKTPRSKSPIGKKK